MSTFYMTLPSNSSMNYYPQNTVAQYTTKLNGQIELDSEWEVGLTVTTMGFIIVTPRVRRATKAFLDGTARFSVCAWRLQSSQRSYKQLLLTESQPTTTQNK